MIFEAFRNEYYKLQLNARELDKTPAGAFKEFPLYSLNRSEEASSNMASVLVSFGEDGAYDDLTGRRQVLYCKTVSAT